MVKSEWVESLFGASADYGTENVTYTDGTTATVPKGLTLPPSADVSNSECSFELLGFVKLNDSTPFSSIYTIETVYGEAPMTIAQSSVSWTCYYRSMTESFRVPEYYWSIFFYCPAPDNAVCTGHHEMDSDLLLTGHLRMERHNTTWKSRFPYHNKTETEMVAKPVKPTACLAIPYKSSMPDKGVVNGAMLYEWVRYYSILGFKVYVYDRYGANRHFIYNSTYGNANNQQGTDWLSNIVYIKHTVFSLLDKTNPVPQFDNAIFKDLSNEEQLLNDVSYLDDDKTATLTHCRFETGAIDGSYQVLVADYDEFLYCPNGASSFAGQRHFVHKMMERYTADEVNQIIFLQHYSSDKLEGGKYGTVLDCLTDKVRLGHSIFDCYAGYEYNTGFFYLGKSIHLGYKCPLTDFHSACTSTFCHCPSIMYPFKYELGYNVMPQDDQCVFMHLSTHPRDYVEGIRLPNATRLIFESIPSEFSLMINKEDKYADFQTHYPPVYETVTERRRRRMRGRMMMTEDYKQDDREGE
jgi:hypothetical protein